MTAPDPSQTDVIGEFPATTTQQRCWFLDQVNPGNPALNVAVRWEVRGRVSSDSLERAFQYIIDRHEVLRTRLIERDGVPVQQVVESTPFRLAQLDLRNAGLTDPLERIAEIAHEDGLKPFDLTKAGLIRATLVRFEAERAMLLIVAHQSCFDGYSIGVLGREIGTVTAAFEAGQQPDLPELPLQYGDFALWQKEYLASGVLEEEEAYWAKTLKDAPYFEVEPDKPRPPTRGTGAALRYVDLPYSFPDRLTTRARQEGVSIFTFGAAVLAGCLHRLTGAPEVLFGTQIAGRNEVELEPLLGVFINNLVLRQSTQSETFLADQIQQAKGVVEGALTHQNTPFNKLVEVVNPVRDASRNPIISTNYNLQRVFLEDRAYGNFELISVPSHSPGAVYDLNFTILGRPSGWRINIEYQTDLFEQSTIDALVDLVNEGFDKALGEPKMRLADIPLSDMLASRRDKATRALRRIEKALAAHPHVAEAAAVYAGDTPYAFVTPDPSEFVPLETLPTALMAELNDTLPEKDCPAGISVLAAFPRTSLGDINRALLRAPRVPRVQKPAQSVAVDDDIVAQLRAHWQDILGVGDVPTSGNFFDLGGHSLLVVRLLARIREDWNLELGIASIYENATLGDLARLIAESVADTPVTQQSDWRILPLRLKGEGLPLMAVNNAATALALTEGDPPRPATCVRLFDGNRGIDQSPRSFEEIAAAYAEVVRKAQPKGPYLFYGNCLHGNIALETARVLQNEGEEIAGVVLTDVWEPGYAEALHKNPKTRRAEKIFALKNRIRYVRQGELSLAAALGNYRIIRKTGLLQLAQKLGLIDRVRATDMEEEQERAIAYLSDARNHYRPAPIDMPVLHIVTEITPQGKGFKPSIGWEDVVTGPLKTVQIDKVMVHRGKTIGTEEMAREIEIFLEETRG